MESSQSINKAMSIASRQNHIVKHNSIILAADSRRERNSKSAGPVNHHAAEARESVLNKTGNTSLLEDAGQVLLTLDQSEIL